MSEDALPVALRVGFYLAARQINQNIGRKLRVFVAFWNGIRKSFLLDRDKSFQEKKTKKCQQKSFQDLSVLIPNRN